ncbi:hypothetical protein F4808DRAFT_54253 [Astrocystis sublimbata]|nr:hypothetical protein F4808DRAFT_54253 [Astrocystis sublimbata]
MDANKPELHPPLPIRSNLSLRTNSKRNAPTKDQRSPKVLSEKARLRRSPQYAAANDRTATRTSPMTNPRPFFPASERASAEQQGSKTNTSSDAEKWSPSAEGGVVGREGRHFTVANVGSNGQIFLRPAIRPDNRRHPPVSFPVTPPRTAGLDLLEPEKAQQAAGGEFTSGQWTPTPMTDTPSPNGIRKSAYFAVRPAATRHRRAVSDSTAHDVSPGLEGPNAGVFKVVISKPQSDSKAKTVEDLHSASGPLLQISIPSWKLGTPRFTLKGTPLIRGSSYAPTEDIRSSHASFLKPSPRGELANNLFQPETFSARVASLRSSQSHHPAPAWPVPVGGTPTSPTSKPTGPAFMSPDLVIEPSMFDSLTFKPACDDRSIVRYSQATGAVTAATPPRLVAEITSPSFLDYDLISDFFLTFRAYLNPADLLCLLVARLRWALSQDDESGMIVKVRTFVALRHWILNYFIDDFVVDHHLRVTFCELINDFTHDLIISPPKKRVPFKIVGELKKCWRRVCLQYWDGREFDAELGPEVAITPGGIAGHRDPSLTPSYWETDSSKSSHIEGTFLPYAPHLQERSHMDGAQTAQFDSTMGGIVRPATPEAGAIPLNRQPTSPISVASLDVVSCSFPTKALRPGNHDTSMALGAHPVDPSSIYTNTDPIASTPATITKRMRPQTSHRRNNSLSDSLRERGTVTEKMLYKTGDFLPTFPYSGSLVRGDILPPSQPFIDDGSGCKGASRQTTVFQPTVSTKSKAVASAMSGPGMRKLLGTVRRALSTRGLGISHTQGSFIDIAPIGPRGATMNRLPGTAIVPQAQRSPRNGTKHPFRIDTLGARIAEDFKQAVREDTIETKSGADAAIQVENIEYSAAHLDSSFELRPLSDAAITAGSKSIVIVDGTAPPEHLAMTGALAPVDRSIEMIGESIIRIQDSDLTPPMTPPSDTAHGNTPRRSSYILSQHVYEPSSTASPLPALDEPTTDSESIGNAPVTARDVDKNNKLPVGFVSLPSNKPPPAYLNRHKRQQSVRSYRSQGSLSQRRWASFQSGLAAQSTVKSFDATSYSESSARSETMPPPLRMLRRRPGRDLRSEMDTTQRDSLPLRRSQSFGSLTVYSESMRSSYVRSPTQDSAGFVGVASSDFSQYRGGEVFSLGAMAEQASKRPLSLFSTHSSKPAMRPSFEAEAQKLRAIPDDVDDDGGVESALLKLEGKYQRKVVKLSIEPLKIPSKDLQILSAASSPRARIDVERKQHRHLHLGDEEDLVVSPIGEESAANTFVQDRVPRQSEISSFLSEDSVETYNSIPLLDRGLTDEGRSRTQTLEWRNHSILVDPESPVDEDKTVLSMSSPNVSFEFINMTESLERVAGHASTGNPSEDRSFLNIESDNESELSSELSTEMVEDNSYVPRPLSSNVMGEYQMRSQRYEVPEMNRKPDGEETPIKLTLAEALQMSPATTIRTPELQEHQLWSQKPLPPTPDTTPTTAMYHQALASPSGSLGSRRTPSNAANLFEESAQQSPVHLPFILAFDSEVLAQQFTLIEKDALNEIDWKELIEMKWKDSHNDSRSWVDFLRNTDARGVEVVIARFNIMVKWAISEIVLTQELEERARCIIKLLHIAAHCRMYRNFATMSQITIALTSNEVGRLSQTWALVPATDMKTMSDLQTLVSPTRNFYNLRAEMEGGGNAAETGCIPFIGIYTHDLLFNAQRATEIASSPTTPPLVNFERSRVTASIVKTLLRLLEASTYYQYQPIEGITERCLWMSALSDEDIRKMSEQLQ